MRTCKFRNKVTFFEVLEAKTPTNEFGDDILTSNMIQFKTLAETLMVYFLQLQVWKTLLPVGTLLSLDLRNAVLEIT